MWYGFSRAVFQLSRTVRAWSQGGCHVKRGYGWGNRYSDACQTTEIRPRLEFWGDAVGDEKRKEHRQRKGYRGGALGHGWGAGAG